MPEQQNIEALTAPPISRSACIDVLGRSRAVSQQRKIRFRQHRLMRLHLGLSAESRDVDQACYAAGEYDHGDRGQANRINAPSHLARLGTGALPSFDCSNAAANSADDEIGLRAVRRTPERRNLPHAHVVEVVYRICLDMFRLRLFRLFRVGGEKLRPARYALENRRLRRNVCPARRAGVRGCGGRGGWNRIAQASQLSCAVRFKPV